MDPKKKHIQLNTHWLLAVYDIVILLVADYIMLFLYSGPDTLTDSAKRVNAIASLLIVLSIRIIGGIYRQIWRYGGIQCFIRLLVTDGIAFLVHWIGFSVLTKSEILTSGFQIFLSRLLSLYCINLLGALAIRMIYRYVFKCGGMPGIGGKIASLFLKCISFGRISLGSVQNPQKIRVAIVGAGRVGVSLAEDLLSNEKAAYNPVCFIDSSSEKIGRRIHNLPVFSEGEATLEDLKEYRIQEIIFAIPQMETERRKELYDYYKRSGCRLKVYDYPTMQSATGKRQLREFDIEELLFRKPVDIHDEKISCYYRGKTVLITGGGGSIGSELCRQIAKMNPLRLIILDVYENGAYDIQQELKIQYGDRLDLKVEIVSVCNRIGLERVFIEHRPDIVLHAAAHKHVPLMERNVIEAVENNVFGTLNVVEFAEKYEAKRFLMVSTDKAVNPTNVMGATKRMCEMIVQSHSRDSKTLFCATRFGNVLGSAGSVIPLFKKQIANGGPVTLTDQRIIRYFMTIPEASQLVLQSGAIAKNNDLFVLDMGKPVKILDLAENMIRLAGFEPGRDIDIIETGLRPGEKLYEELLVKTEELDKTENKLIYIERDAPISREELNAKIDRLRQAVETNDDDIVRVALHEVVPTYKSPEEVNAVAKESIIKTMAER